MKSAMGAVFAAIAASACCLGPVLLTAIGSGTLAAASTKLAVVRPVFLMLSVVLLGSGFYRSYGRRRTGAACVDGSCPPAVNRQDRAVLWIVTIAVVLFATFPYDAGYLF